MSGTLDDYDTFKTQLLEALQDYVQTCELLLLISPEAQAQLSQAVLDQSWSDVYFMDVILRCLAVILHTPTVAFTSSLDFPVVHYVPQHPPLSPASNLSAMSIEDASMFWLLTHPRCLPGDVTTAPMHYPLAADEVHTTAPMPSSTMATYPHNLLPGTSSIQGLATSPSAASSEGQPTTVPVRCSCGHSMQT